MRKTCAILLCAALMLCMLPIFTACGVAGTYVISAAEMQGKTFDADALNAMGYGADNCYITLQTDGKGILCIFGEGMLIAWQDNTLWPQDNRDDIQTFEIDGKDLILEYAGEKLIFTKE